MSLENEFTISEEVEVCFIGYDVIKSMRFKLSGEDKTGTY